MIKFELERGIHVHVWRFEFYFLKFGDHGINFGISFMLNEEDWKNIIDVSIWD